MTEKLKRGGNWMFSAREVGKYPNVYVAVPKSGQVELRLALAVGELNYSFMLDRRLARTTAKRILAALEATR